jgi:transcription termination factor Rho
VAEKLDDLHLADLHALAARVGVPRFRMLRRPQLIREIESRGGAPEDAPTGPAATEAPPVVDATDAETPPEGTPAVAEPELQREPLETVETEEVTGVLEITSQRYGFLRLRGLQPHPDDVYISASQVRRCELRPGDEVSGPARAPRRGERHRALVHVDRVDGGDPQAEERREFDELTPILPTRRLLLDRDPGDVLTRAVDLLAPMALGQRVLVWAAPRSGRTTLLRGLARAIAVADVELIVLLIDERPEEVTGWREALPNAEIASATADLPPADQVRLADLALERARRRVEAGVDVVTIVDSLSRLAVAARSTGGRSPSADAAEVKRLFGSGRDLAEEGAGSLTVVATVVEGAEDDGAAQRAVMTTESSLIHLDPELAASGVVPALRPGECRVSNEDELRDPGELAAARRLRSLLADLDPAEAAALLRERIEGSPTNAELLASV